MRGVSLGGPQPHQSSKMKPAGTNCHHHPTTKHLHHRQLPAGARLLPELGTKLGELVLTQDAPDWGGCWWWPGANLPRDEDGSGMLHQHCRPMCSPRGSLLLTRGPFEADAVVGVVPVLAGPPVFAGLALALVDVDVAAVARVAGLAEAGEGGNAVLAGAVVTRVRVTLIDVDLAVSTRETWQERHRVRMRDTGWGWGTHLPTLPSCEPVHRGGFTCPTVSCGTPRSRVQAGSILMCWRWGWSDPSPGGFVPGCTMTRIKAAWAAERGPALARGSSPSWSAWGGGGRPQAPPNNNPPPAAPILLARSLPTGFGGGEPRTKYSFD